MLDTGLCRFFPQITKAGSEVFWVNWKKQHEVSSITHPKNNVFWQPSLVPNKPLIAIETGSEKNARALMEDMGEKRF